MKIRIWTIIATLFMLTACKDSSAPVFSSFKINGQEIDLNNPSFSAGINESATFQIISMDDTELLQLIAFIDTTGLGDKERLYADGLSGKESFSEFTFAMRTIDSLAQLYFFGEALPVTFTLIDNSQNTTSVTVPMTAL
jgi:hypothetical protein